MATEEPTSETIEWFRSNFSHEEKDGHITLKDFKHASHRNCHVSYDAQINTANVISPW